MINVKVGKSCELGNQQPSPLESGMVYGEGSETIPYGSRLQVESKCGTVESRWHKKYPCCVRCGRTEYRHVAKGLCNSCYMSDYYKNHEEKIILQKKEWYQKNWEDCRAKAEIRREKSSFSGKRKEALLRDNCTCQACGKLLTSKSAIVHHIDGKGRGVPRDQRNNSLDNLVTLCRSCHIDIHRNELHQARGICLENADSRILN